MLAQSRQQLIEESLLDPTKQRYGLFSYSTLAIGDDSIGRSTKPRRDAEGHVETAPKNFYTKRMRRGKSPDVYFTKPAFCTIGDPYVKKSPKKVVTDSDVPPFKPAGSIEEKIALFPHEQTEVYKKKNFRDAEGAVVLEPKNILAIPPKKGEAASTPGLVFSSVPAVTEPYDRKHQLEKEEKEKSKARNKHERAFRGISHGDRNFADNVKTFGKIEMPARSPPRPLSVPVVEHDRPFKPANPAKKGICDMTIGKFPEYKTGSDPKKPLRPVTDERRWK